MTQETYAFEHHMICATDINCFPVQLTLGLCPTSDIWKVIMCEQISKFYLSTYTDEYFSFKISVRCKISRKQFYNSLCKPGRKVRERFFPSFRKTLSAESLIHLWEESSVPAAAVLWEAVPRPALDSAFSTECLDLVEQLEDSQSQTVN